MSTRWHPLARLNLQARARGVLILILQGVNVESKLFGSWLDGCWSLNDHLVWLRVKSSANSVLSSTHASKPQAVVPCEMWAIESINPPYRQWRRQCPPFGYITPATPVICGAHRMEANILDSSFTLLMINGNTINSQLAPLCYLHHTTKKGSRMLLTINFHKWALMAGIK